MKKNDKEFDAVKMAKEIKEKIGKDIDGMSFKELRRYIDDRLENKSSIKSKQKPA